VSIYFNVAGPKMYVDAAWKTRPGHDAARPKLGVYLVIPDGHGATSDVLISATSAPVSSALQVEAGALLLAAEVASSLILQEPVFFTDCFNLARVLLLRGQIPRQHFGKSGSMPSNCPQKPSTSRETSMLLKNFDQLA
jgi:hypothetical protein